MRERERENTSDVFTILKGILPDVCSILQSVPNKESLHSYRAVLHLYSHVEEDFALVKGGEQWPLLSLLQNNCIGISSHYKLRVHFSYGHVFAAFGSPFLRFFGSWIQRFIIVSFWPLRFIMLTVSGNWRDCRSYSLSTFSDTWYAGSRKIYFPLFIRIPHRINLLPFGLHLLKKDVDGKRDFG